MTPLLDAVELGTALYVFVLVFTFVGTGLFIAPSVLAHRVHQREDLTEDQKSAWRNVMWFIPYAWIFYLLVDDEVTAGMFTVEIPRDPGEDEWAGMSHVTREEDVGER